MPIVSFHLSSPERSDRIDKARFDRLEELLDRMRGEVAREAGALQRRHSDLSLSAASAQAQLENEGETSLSPQIDDLTRSLMQHSRRISELKTQLAFLGDLERHVASFLEKLDKDGS